MSRLTARGPRLRLLHGHQALRLLVHKGVKLGLPNHVIAAQAGWSEKSVEKMVETYAHSEIGALDVIERRGVPCPMQTRP